jgi:tRNA A-37 threonylcarbamoyl transferase component Bud32
VAGPSESIARSPADVLRLVTAVATLLVFLAIGWLFGDTIAGFLSDLLRGLDALPDWVVEAVAVGARVAAVVAFVAGLVFTVARVGTRMLLTVAAGAGLAVLLVVLLNDIPDVPTEDVPAHLAENLGPLTDGDFPSGAGIAAFAAALTAGAPWLSRRWRRWGWVAVGGLVVTRFVTSPLSMDSLKSALIGWTAGAAVLVALGAPSRRATREAIAEGLAACGLPLASLEPASVDARGSTPYFGVAEDGTRLFVKALGTDQRSADLLFRLYRSTQRHDLGDERPFSSLRRAVEHEALLALAAHDRGIPTPRMRALAVVEPSSYVLAYEAIEGKSLDGVAPEQLTDAVLADVWHELGRLRGMRIAHRDLRLANIFLGSDGKVWMIDFGFSEMAASDLLLANDVAELIASSSSVVGPDRAIAQAVASVDPVTLAAARERLHPWSLSGASRTAMKASPGLLDDLRARLVTA